MAPSREELHPVTTGLAGRVDRPSTPSGEPMPDLVVADHDWCAGTAVLDRGFS
ncbi:hypothetical protein [Nocardia sp. NPDC059228]|uniref:hypothetical protein n=1 Tax=Nocardia sp. NPDC059228 TaxID=3346777 RepID=UPI00369A3B79